MRRRLRCAGALAVALAAVPTSSLSVRDTAAVAIVRAHARQVAQPTFRTGTTRIVLDVVVRGRDHKPLPGLVQADFEVFEDGRQRPLTSVEEVQAAPASRSAARARQRAGWATQLSRKRTSDRRLVFEELGPEARQFARAAAASLVAVDSPVRAGVFVLRGGLEEVLPLTLDGAAIRRAIDVASERPGCPVFESHLGHRQAQMTACSPAGESQTHRQRGVNTFDGLATVVEALGMFPGRKTVALFLRAWISPAVPAASSVTTDAAASRSSSPARATPTWPSTRSMRPACACIRRPPVS